MIRNYTFEDLIRALEDRLAKINYEKEKYSMEILPEKEDTKLKIVSLRYDNVKILQFIYYVARRKVNNKMELRSIIEIRVQKENDSEWYNISDDANSKTVTVTESGCFGYDDKREATIDEALNDLLPLPDPDKINIIIDELEARGVKDYTVLFDTFNRRYIVQGCLNKTLGIIEPDISESSNDYLYLYKYMSLKTYFSMLINKTYRMNSITSMNDDSESFFLNDELFEIYSGKGKEQKYLTLIENSRILISSFTDKKDSGLMWRLYGESGKGVCLRFKIEKDRVKKIHYINEKSEGYLKLKRIVQTLKTHEIEIVFRDEDDFNIFMKSDGFKYEDEYRMTSIRKQEELSWTMYGNLISSYIDFPFNNNKSEEIGLSLCEVVIGAKIPNFDVNYPLLVELTNKIFKVNKINISQHNKFRE